jgi:hypothetical protein
MSKLRARRPVDQQAAESFVSGAESPPAPRPEIRPTPTEPSQPLREPPAPPKPLTEPMPWEGLPDNANRPFQLRLPAPVYAKLQWASERAGKSMHRIALEAVRQAVEREVRKHLG